MPSSLVAHRGKRNRRIVLSAGAGIAQRVLQLASTIVLMPVLLRVLGAAQFGVWGAASSLAWLAGLADVGTGAALVTLVARSSARDTTDEARQHLAGALGFGSGLAALILMICAAVMAMGVPKGWITTYLIAIAGLATNVPLSTANNVWTALQEGYVAAFWESVQTVLTLVGVLAAAQVTRELWVYVIVVYAGLVLANLGSLLHLLWRHAELRPHREAFSIAAMRKVAGEGMTYFALGIAGGISFFLDNILALELLGPEASAQMTIAMRICMMAVSVLLVLTQPLWPAFAEAAERVDHRWIRRSLASGIAGLSAATIAGSAILLVWGDALLRWWLKADLGISRALLWAVCCWIFAQALTRVPHLLLNGVSEVRFQVGLFLVASLIALALKFTLAQRIGVGGILWATTFTVALLDFPGMLWRIGYWARHALPKAAEAQG